MIHTLSRTQFQFEINHSALHYGKGKDPYQHCRHRTRRLRQVHDHRASHLQMRWNRQAYHREVREGSPGDGQGFLQVRVGTRQAEGLLFLNVNNS